MKTPGTLILTRKEISELMSFGDYVTAAEDAFRLHAEGKSLSPKVLDVASDDGVFHVKAAGLRLGERIFVAVKINGNFPANRQRHGLPTIQGAIVLSNGDNGYPLAILDSTEITAQRTGAATAAAAKYLARRDSKTAAVFGCGKQGRIQLIALKHCLPIQQAFVYDVNASAAHDFAIEMGDMLGIAIHAVQNGAEAATVADAIVTCTTAREAFLRNTDIPPGSFIAAVGADSHDKQELDPKILSTNTLVTDITSQCAGIGELHHAIAAKLMTTENVYAELAEIIGGRKPGRRTDSQTIIFDSTGTAIQDVAAAAVVYERAIAKNAGLLCDLIS